MKYLDFVLVLCLVSLGVWFWVGPTSHAVASPQEIQSRATPKAVQESPSVVKLKDRKNGDETLPTPTLELSFVGESDKLDALTIRAVLTTPMELLINMESQSIPRVSLVFTSQDKSWSFESKESGSPEKRLASYETMTWETKVSSFSQPSDMNQLRDLYGRVPVTVRMIVDQREPDTDPFVRRMIILVSGSLEIPVENS